MKDLFLKHILKKRDDSFMKWLCTPGAVSIQAKGFRWCLGELTLTVSGGRGCLAYVLVIHDCGTDYSQIQWLRTANSYLHLVCVWLHLAAYGMSVPSPGDGTCALWSANTNSLPQDCQRRPYLTTFGSQESAELPGSPGSGSLWSSRGSSRADPLPSAWGVFDSIHLVLLCFGQRLPLPSGPSLGQLTARP